MSSMKGIDQRGFEEILKEENDFNEEKFEHYISTDGGIIHPASTIEVSSPLSSKKDHPDIGR